MHSILRKTFARFIHVLYLLPLRTAKHTAVSTVDWTNLDQLCTKTMVHSTVMPFCLEINILDYNKDEV